MSRKRKKNSNYAKPTAATAVAAPALNKKTVILIAVSAVLLAAIVFGIAFCALSTKTRYAKITVKDHGVIILALDEKTAPITVNNFLDLANSGFYNGLTFHRIIKDFMIQGGDPDATGGGGSDNKIKGEFSANGVTNNISHVRGVISMARSNAYNSASSQFFICNADSTHLDGSYAAFGKVIAGMDVVDSITEYGIKYTVDGVIPVYLKSLQPVITEIVEITEAEAFSYLEAEKQ